MNERKCLNIHEPSYVIVRPLPGRFGNFERRLRRRYKFRPRYNLGVTASPKTYRKQKDMKFSSPDPYEGRIQIAVRTGWGNPVYRNWGLTTILCK